LTLDGIGRAAKLTAVDALLNHQPPANGSVRIRPGRRNALRQALQLQQRVFDEGIKPGVTPVALAQLARAWDTLEERKRILRGRPLPGSLKPEKPKPKRRPGYYDCPAFHDPSG
jgi:hypothetical protein